MALRGCRSTFQKNSVALQGTEKVANIWFDHWNKADSDFGAELKQKCLDANGGKWGNPMAVPASKA